MLEMWGHPQDMELEWEFLMSYHCLQWKKETTEARGRSKAILSGEQKQQQARRSTQAITMVAPASRCRTKRSPWKHPLSL
ncbi:hypothetical protein AHAS_Ahas17G0254700 [Arachis hypogaea]